jgi:two-component system OmpR family sensor kinase
MKWRWLMFLALLPAIIVIVLNIWITLSEVNNPIIYLRIDVGSLLFILGIGVSALALAGLGLRAKYMSEQQNSQQRVAEDRRRFLRRLDHELKNPLTAILAGLANQSAAETEEQRSIALVSVDAQVQRLRGLVADLRKLSDLETRPLEQSQVNLTELLEDAFSLVQDLPEAPERRLDISIPRAPWPLPTIAGDRDLLFLAVYNLLNNALKFTHSGDTVEMRAFEDNANVVVEIADTGPGIPDEEAPHVWEELYRGSDARGIPGSGLGLALVRAIVLRHGGDVALRSRSGQGTVFTMRLPVGETASI